MWWYCFISCDIQVSLTSGSQDSTSQIQIASPSPGRWFTASYLNPDNATKHIRPQVNPPCVCDMRGKSMNITYGHNKFIYSSIAMNHLSIVFLKFLTWSQYSKYLVQVFSRESGFYHASLACIIPVICHDCFLTRQSNSKLKYNVFRPAVKNHKI